MKTVRSTKDRSQKWIMLNLDPEVLKDEVVSLRQRVEELTQQPMRLQTDFDNYRKRSRRDLQEGLSEPMRSWSDSFCRY